MCKEYIKVTYGGETIYTIDNEIFKNEFLGFLMSVPAKVSEVTLVKQGTETKRKAKQFIITEGAGCKLFGGVIYLMLPKSSVVNVYID
jgi:hypothetical protein